MPVRVIPARHWLCVPDDVSGRPAVGPTAAAGETDVRPSPGRSRPEPDVIPDEFVLSFFDNNDRAAFIKLAKSKGGEILDVSDFGHAVRVRVGTREQFQELLEEGPAPVNYSPNYYVLSPELPDNDRREPAPGGYVGFGSLALQWLGVRGDRSSWGKGITIAVLDTGVVPHPALLEENITRISLMNGETGESGDYQGHGTAVASLIAGTASDVPGIAPAVEILSIQVLSGEGVGDTFTLARGIVEAIDRGAGIINLCLGTYGDSFILKEAVDFALQKDVAIVAATGNDAIEGVSYPARYDSVLAVSAVDAAGQHLFFANRGEEVDLAAPGLGVNAAWPGKPVANFSGTSVAVPFVSGALAALLSENRKISADDAADILYRYCDDAGAPGKDEELGHGILSIGRVMDRDVKGIYDVAVADPYLRPAAAGAEELAVLVYAQNRGTENLARVDLKVEIDAVSHVLNFYDVGVGQTVSHEFRVNLAMLKHTKYVSITFYATVHGAQDSNSANNGRRTVLLVYEPGE